MDLEYLKNITLKIHGVDFSVYDESFFSGIIEKRMKKIQSNSLEDYCELVLAHKTELQELIKSFNVNYSEFFRNSLTYSVLEHIVLPDLLQKKINHNKLEARIWSAACAAGQEPYSVAILFEELLNGKVNAPGYRIFATDQSEANVDEARKGLYQPLSLNKITIQRLNKWFTKTNNQYTINAEIRQNIDFSVFNLLDERQMCPKASIFGGFDIILLCNILFYYTETTRHQIIRKIEHCAAAGAYLLTGETEREILLQSGFSEVYPYSCIFVK